MEQHQQPENPDQAASLRITDAALNRAAEGLRVCDDCVRFALDDALLTSLLKDVRHELAELAAQTPSAARHAARDTPGDVGREISNQGERSRENLNAVCAANFERAKQSLRSLEEISKTSSAELARRFEALRYRVYTIEAAWGRTVDASQRLADVQLCVLASGGDSEAAFSKLAESLIAGNVGMIQLREKHLDDRRLAARARKLVALARNASTARPLIIVNDRPDIAAAANADGVHVGQDDLCVKDARKVVGPGRLVGVSTHKVEQARAAVLDGANYLGVGPVFTSATKTFADYRSPADYPGLDFVDAVTRLTQLPVFAIGGIDAGNVDQVLERGARRIAVSSAVITADNPADAAKRLIAKLGPQR